MGRGWGLLMACGCAHSDFLCRDPLVIPFTYLLSFIWPWRGVLKYFLMLFGFFWIKYFQP